MNDIDKEEVLDIYSFDHFRVHIQMFNCNDVLICLIWLIKIGYINGGKGVVINDTRERRQSVIK